MRVLKATWRGWLKFAQVLGTVQMVIVLTVIYWTLLAIIAIPFKIVADPLLIKKPGRSRWIRREGSPQTLEEMQRQG